MINPIALIANLKNNAMLIAVVAIVAFASGWTVHGWKTNSGQLTGIQKQVKQAEVLQNESKPIIEKKIDNLQKTEIVYRTIREKIYEKNDTDICFDADSLSLWNSAIAGADNHRPELAREATENEAVVANVTEVLTNAADNFKTCNDNIIKHNALIDKAESLNGKMCVCGE